MAHSPSATTRHNLKFSMSINPFLWFGLECKTPRRRSSLLGTFSVQPETTIWWCAWWTWRSISDKHSISWAALLWLSKCNTHKSASVLVFSERDPNVDPVERTSCVFMEQVKWYESGLLGRILPIYILSSVSGTLHKHLSF